MKTYTYKGKDRTAAGGKMIVPNGRYELDEKDSHVRSLVDQGLLQEEVKQYSKPEKSKK